MWGSGNASSKVTQPQERTVAGITFTHKQSKRARRLSVKVESSAAVVVVTPPRVREATVDRFVTEHADWITHTRKKYLAALPDKDTVIIFGNTYTKQLSYHADKPLKPRVVGNRVIVNTPELLQNPDLQWSREHSKQLETFLDTAARKYIGDRLVQLAEKMKLKYNRVSYKKQSTRWGSCSSDKNLNFNLKLVHAPTAVIDYVIVHELAHLKHMDHSARFWNLVGQYDPDYQVHRGWLKRNSGGMSVG